jgi:F-type H+-transporting ATPase subunit delta
MSLARRYAKALLSISEQLQSVEKTADTLDDLHKAFREYPELDSTVKNPMFTLEQRKAVLMSVCEAIQMPQHLGMFLGFLFDRDRFSLLPDLARVFRRLADDRTGTLRGEVISASELGAGELERLRAALNQATGRTIALETKQDTSLMGGAVARVGDVIFDGSVRTQLAQMRSALLGDN